jgi:hypothetical protein
MRQAHSRLYGAMLAAPVVGLLMPQVALAAFVKLSGPMPDFGDVFDFRISPDSSHVVYVADQETDEVWELYVADDGQTQFGLYLPLVVRGSG